ncbi:MAG: hypothetical protein HY784_00815 [Chloroflexi bacterium]|nr:hypothetical protein [Chloroflexota bacterium]
MSNLAQTHDGVQDHWSRLANQWRITLGLWNDPVRRRFEREYWQGYEVKSHFINTVLREGRVLYESPA